MGAELLLPVGMPSRALSLSLSSHTDTSF
jgi:hypothetical protein